jgi:hypothetical protein
MAVKPSALFLGSSVLACWRRQYSFGFSEPACRRDSLSWPEEGGLKWLHLCGGGVSS